LTGKWRAHGQKANPKPLKPATVNRELDTLKSIRSKAVEWGKLVESPARGVKRLRVDNRRTILTEDEQRAILGSAPRKMRAFITLALITAARAGELLGLRWEHVTEDALLLLETKNGKPRRIPLSPSARAVLAALPRVPGRPMCSPTRRRRTATR
jgi:integrase